MPWHIKRLENGLLVQEYDQEPDDKSEELLTPDGRTQDECHPRFAHLKPGESVVLPDEPKTTTSGSWYPSQYEDLGEFLNGDPGAIDKLDSSGRSRRFNWRYYEPDESFQGVFDGLRGRSQLVNSYSEDIVYTVFSTLEWGKFGEH